MTLGKKPPKRRAPISSSELTLVDKWFRWLKSRLISGALIAVAIVILAIGNVADAVTRIGAALSQFIRPAPQLVVEALSAYQTPFEVDSATPKGGVTWTGYYSVINVSDHALAIEGFEAEFHSRSQSLRLTPRRSSVPTSYYAQVTNREEDLQQDHEKLRLEYGPFLIEPGVKRYFGFPVHLDITQGDQLLTTGYFRDVREMRRTVQVAVGGFIDSKGECRTVFGPHVAVVKLAGGRQVRLRLHTMLMVPGCVIPQSWRAATLPD